MPDTVIVCTRCAATTTQGADEFVNWEEIDGKAVCPRCITGEDRQAIDDDYHEPYMEADDA